MSQQPLRFALFGNEYQPKKSTSVEKILSYLVNKGFIDFQTLYREILEIVER